MTAKPAKRTTTTARQKATARAIRLTVEDGRSIREAMALAVAWQREKVLEFARAHYLVDGLTLGEARPAAARTLFAGTWADLKALDPGAGWATADRALTEYNGVLRKLGLPELA